MELYDSWLKENGYKFLNSGLIHNVYEKNNNIFKIVKSNIVSSNTDNHFEKEATCLKFLYDNGFDVVQTKKIYHKGELVKDFCVLEETKIDGKCYNEYNIPKDCVILILKFIQKVSNISLKEYGVIFDKKINPNKSWTEYLEEQIAIAKKIIKKYFNNDVILINQLKKIDYKYLKKVKSNFLIMDPNPENFIFTNDKMIAIDIDHPIGGDKLWQSACFYWYKEQWLLEMESLNYFNKKNYSIFVTYCMIFGLNTFDFLEKSSIKIEDWHFKRMQRLMEEIANE